jgi:hypothetical protein
MMNLNLGSCDFLLMFIVLVVALVFKLKALIISLLFFLFGGNISVIVYEYV